MKFCGIKECEDLKDRYREQMNMFPREKIQKKKNGGRRLGITKSVQVYRKGLDSLWNSMEFYVIF